MEFGFYLKKAIGFFIEPLGMVLTLFALGLYFLFAKKERRSFYSLISSFTLLILFAYPPFANFLVSNLESRYPKYDYSQDIKYIHVLGNGHTTDKKQPISSQLSSAGVKRVLEGVIIYKNSPDAKLIFTGYKGKTDTSNAEMNSRLAIALGVKKEDIIINGLPKDTKEEAEFTRTLVGKEAFVLVTSATHIPRSMKLFESLGLHPIAAPTNFLKVDNVSYFRTPDTDSLDNSTVAMHEYFGLLWSVIKD